MRTRHSNGNGAMEQQCGHGLRKVTITETDTDERNRNAGNQA